VHLDDNWSTGGVRGCARVCVGAPGVCGGVHWSTGGVRLLTRSTLKSHLRKIEQTKEVILFLGLW